MEKAITNLSSIVNKYGKDIVSFALLLYLVITLQSRVNVMIEYQNKMSTEFIKTIDNIRKEDELKRREDRMYYVNYTIESDKTIRELSNALVENTHKIELLEREVRELRK